MQKPFPFSIDRWLIIWKGCTVISLRQASGPLWKLTLIALYKHLAFVECCYWFFLSIFKCRNNTEQIAGPMILHEDLVPLQIATTMVTVKHGERKKDILKNAADAGDEGQHDTDELLFFFTWWKTVGVEICSQPSCLCWRSWFQNRKFHTDNLSSLTNMTCQLIYTNL